MKDQVLGFLLLQQNAIGESFPAQINAASQSNRGVMEKMTAPTARTNPSVINVSKTVNGPARWKRDCKSRDGL